MQLMAVRITLLKLHLDKCVAYCPNKFMCSLHRRNCTDALGFDLYPSCGNS